MKANEIQISDWLYSIIDSGDHTEKKLCKVTGIRTDSDVPLIQCDDTDVWYPLDSYEPIPLTAEILKKNGFEYYHKNFASLRYDHQFKLKMEKWPDENGLGGLWSITDLIKIRYVHELQQAMRMCSIEKEIIL